ncbi:hypothetical protein BDV93DRAFT_547424 [Ceratobasidium sp. AG-I]|nr:hypothetical protein BDV93DRAFT_547424 [Ceratobasidium sp. AG-I]
MPPKLSGPGAERTRHRIAGIEIAPSPSNRRISANLLVDNKIVCSLPWIEEGAPLRWTRLIVCDAFPGSEIVLDVCEEHTLRDKRFRSDAYLISSAQQQSKVSSKIAKTPWTATFELMTPDKVEQSFAEGLQKLSEMEQAPSVLDKLGKARPVFKTMLEFGSVVAELHPTAKIVFAVCEKAWKRNKSN